MLRIWGDSDDTLIVEHTDRPPIKVVEGARYDGSDLVLADYVLYDDNLFDVDEASYRLYDPETDFACNLITRWVDMEISPGYVVGQRTFQIVTPNPGWTYTTVRVQSERNARNSFLELHIEGPGTHVELERIA